MLEQYITPQFSFLVNELIFEGESLLEEDVSLPAELELYEAVEDRLEDPTEDGLCPHIAKQCGLLRRVNLMPLLRRGDHTSSA